MSSFLVVNIDHLIGFIIGIMVILIGYRVIKIKVPNEKYNLWAKILGCLLTGLSVFMVIQNFPKVAMYEMNLIAKGIKTKANLPREIDSETRWLDVKANGAKELVYVFSIFKMSSSALNLESFRTKMKALVLENFCKSSEISNFFKKGINLRLIYLTKDNVEAANFLATPESCQKKE